LKVEENDRMRERTALADDRARVSRYGIAGVTLLAFVLLGGVGIVLARSITRPLRRLQMGVDVIRRGKLDHPVDIDSKDEAGELARAFDRMAEKRQQAVEAIRDTVNRLTSAGAEILASTAQQAAGAQEQAAAVSQAVATVDQVSQTADQAAQRAKGVGE